MEKTFNDSQLITLLRGRVKGASYRKVGLQLGIDPTTICNIVKGHRAMNESVASKLGFVEIPKEASPRRWAAKPSPGKGAR